MDRSRALERICREHGVAAVYLFGSRGHDGVLLLRGEDVDARGSDLDVALLFADPPPEPGSLSNLQVEIEDVFAPLRVDVVPLHTVDPIFQFRAIAGERVLALGPRLADVWELEAMREAAELLPVQREMERERFGTHTT